MQSTLTTGLTTSSEVVPRPERPPPSSFVCIVSPRGCHRVFKHYLKDKLFIDRHMHKYDRSGKGHMSKDDLLKMMSVMAEGKFNVTMKVGILWVESGSSGTVPHQCLLCILPLWCPPQWYARL